MNKVLMLALATTLAGVTVPASADEQADPNSLSARVMQNHPGTHGGHTVSPTSRPDDDGGGIQRKAMKEHPGNTGGRTSDPRAKPDTNSIQGSEMGNHPGVN